MDLKIYNRLQDVQFAVENLMEELTGRLAVCEEKGKNDELIQEMYGTAHCFLEDMQEWKVRV